MRPTVTATYQQRGRGRDRRFQVFIRPRGMKRITRTVHSEDEARDLAQHFNRLGLAGVDLAAALAEANKRAETPAPEWPKLRDALPAFIDEMTSLGEWTGGTPINYRRALALYVYPFKLADGRELGDLRVDEVTERMLGAILDSMRAAGRSMAVREHVRCPLARFYRNLIRKRGYTGPNPAADLKEYMGRHLSKRARRAAAYPYFTQEEAPKLFKACQEQYPRYLAFIGCCALAGLRWGEAAGLERDDILWSKGVIHLRRTWSWDARAVKDLKDHENRYVPMAAQLADWLKAHLEAMDLEAQMKGWSQEQRRLVFPNKAGSHLHHPTFLKKIWAPLLKAAGLRYRKPHATRHSFATWCLEGNEDLGIKPENILRVRDWMGHSSVEETERYAHVNSVHAGRSLDALGALVAS